MASERTGWTRCWGAVSAATCRRTPCSRRPTSSEPQGLRRHHRPSQLRPHQDGAAGDPGASGARAAAGGRRLGAARALRHLRSTRSRTTASRSRHASTWWSKARTSSRLPSRPVSGSSSLPRCSTTFEPDVVVTVADRYETIATAVAAAYNNIPLAHIQGGEISGLDRREGSPRGHEACRHPLGLHRRSPATTSFEWVRTPDAVHVVGGPGHRHRGRDRRQSRRSTSTHSSGSVASGSASHWTPDSSLCFSTR